MENTYQLLQSLQCAVPANPLEVNNNVIESLVQALLRDGYELQNTYAHHLRGLAEEEADMSDPVVVISNLIPVAVCVICAGFASGLTQGLLALDFMEMKIKSQSGTAKEKEYANKVIPIIKNHHLLLVSLMLWNASATEALPIFLNKLVPEFVSIIISVTLVLMFGEIIPASILTGPAQLQIAATLTPLVYFVLVIFFPIAYPLSLLLDRLIGHDEGVTMYSRGEIVTMMRIQHEEGMRRTNDFRDTMNQDEVTIIGGALTFRDQIVCNAMTPLHQVFMIQLNDKLSYETVYNIFKAGYSRIPVYDKDRNDIVSLILAKDLIFVDPEDEISISNFIDMFGRKPIFVWHDDKLGETLSTFRHERAHLALVRDVENQCDGDPYYKVVGLITLEDIIEEILGTEIEDETDFTSETGNHGPLRDIDLARLKSLSSKITDETLSADEIEAIANYLDDNVPEIHEVIKGGKDALKQLVEKSGVLTMKKKSPDGEKAHHEDYIFRKGKVSNSCIVILQGRVKVLRGEKEEYEEMKGPWTTIAADALSVKEGTFIPDFSAYIESEYLRFVRITTFQEDHHSEGWTSHRNKLQKYRSHLNLTNMNNHLSATAAANTAANTGNVFHANHNRTIYTSPLKRRATHHVIDSSAVNIHGNNNNSNQNTAHHHHDMEDRGRESATGRSISTGGLVPRESATGRSVSTGGLVTRMRPSLTNNNNNNNTNDNSNIVTNSNTNNKVTTKTSNLSATLAPLFGSVSEDRRPLLSSPPDDDDGPSTMMVPPATGDDNEDIESKASVFSDSDIPVAHTSARSVRFSTDM